MVNSADRQPTPFGWYLIRLMAAHDPQMTQSDLARRTNIGQATISRWIYGSAKPDPDKLALLADALGLDHNDLLHRAGHTTTAPTPRTDPTDHPIAAEIRVMLGPDSPLPLGERNVLETVLNGVLTPYRHHLNP